MWNECRAACDEFFNRRNEDRNNRKTDENSNLEKKNAIIEQITDIAEGKLSEGKEKIKELIKEFNETGHVPYDLKEEMYKRFRSAVDKAYDKLNIKQEDRERNAAELKRMAQRLESEIKTAENNIMFLIPKGAKKLSPIVEQMQKNIDAMKQKLDSLQNKIAEKEKTEDKPKA